MIDALLLEALALKALPRAGWVRKGVADVESVAAHSWGVAWLVLALLPAELDLARALSYAVIHDIAEIRVGDLTPHDGVPPQAKARLEADAVADLFAQRPDLETLWAAYEAQRDPEARFVRQLDRLDMALQAVRYAQLGTPNLAEFLESAAAAIEHPDLVALLERLRANPVL